MTAACRGFVGRALAAATLWLSFVALAGAQPLTTMSLLNPSAFEHPTLSASGARLAGTIPAARIDPRGREGQELRSR